MSPNGPDDQEEFDPYQEWDNPYEHMEDPTGATPWEETGDEVPLEPHEQAELEALANMEDTPPADEQLVDEEATVDNPLELLPIAIQEHRHLQIEYMNRHGDIKTYVAEPYEIGSNKGHAGGYLWIYDTYAETTKSFLLDRVMNIQLLNTTFIPRW